MANNNVGIVQNTATVNAMTSGTDLRNFLSNNGLKITSNGQYYELKYGNFSFSGAADVEFTESKEETKFKNSYRVHTTYTTETKYQTQTFYKTVFKTKNLSVAREGVSLGGLIWIVVVSVVIGALLGQLIKTYLKQ